MADEERPNPEELLEIVKREELQSKKGKLKIFLGMAAGVGKTYAMLESAQQLIKNDVDVVVGVVETHGRQDTAKILQGLEVVPPLKIDYKGSTFKELDIDAVVKRNPEIILIDELAHSNIPGSRHPKRWQDVLEILDNGIDVYTTLNVQHIESRADLVEGISGIKIHETVPDSIIDAAASIELVDITPEELLERLKEGKVYLGDQSAIAAQNFFKQDRLTALREIVMRYAAEKVDHDLHGMFSMVERSEAWKTRERLLVAVSHSSHSQKLIRITRRLAFTLNAPWIALHVDDGKVLDEEEQKALSNNLALARDLGAEVITATGEETASVIQRVARQKSVTQIIIGRSPTRWRWLTQFFFRDSLLDKLSRDCSDIDLHVIRKSMYNKNSSKGWFQPVLPQNVLSYFAAGAFVVLMTLINVIFLPNIGYHVTGFIFLLAILGLSLMFKKGPVFFASVLYALIWYFYFIPGSKLIPEATKEDIILLTMYLLTALSMGVLIDRTKTSKLMLLKREKSLETLYEIVQDIAGGATTEDILFGVNNKIGSVLNGTSEIVLKKIDDGLIFDSSKPLLKDDKEKAAANWVYLNGKEAGWSTSTLPLSKNLYIPLKSADEVVGVLVFNPNRESVLGIEEMSFLYTVAHQLANYFEKNFSEERARRLAQHRQVEKIYQSILNLISNLFEGPLLTIQDGVKDLIQDGKKVDIERRKKAEQIDTAVKNLVRILENISAMVNLSAGLLPVRRQRSDLGALVTACHAKLTKIEPSFEWKLTIHEGLPEIQFDHDLIELLLYNLAFHALEYAIPESIIIIEISQDPSYLIVSIQSQGQSIPLEMFEVAFEKFYRMPGSKLSGLGFGFAIAKTIAEIHNGKILVQPNPAGGMIFNLYLPLE